MKRPLGALFLAMALPAAAGCGDGNDAAATEAKATAAAISNYARIVEASYADSLDGATLLKETIAEFLRSPNEARLNAARKAWKDAREPYLQTEVYRFYDGPIDDPEGLMNAWPLDESYIDYVEGDDDAGIVNDPRVTISAESLSALNEKGGEENIATGYHAVEFLLWGQDHDEDGPGDRPATDYALEGSRTAEHQDRRALYLATVSELLVENLAGLVAAWAPAADYRVELESVAPKEALRRVLTGMIVLSGFETGGERVQTALDSGNQEDEHSCFSDNTHRDMIQDVQGVWNVYHGRYTSPGGQVASGTGIRDLVAARDPALADRLGALIDESLARANAIVPPFDREIRFDNPEGRERVQALADALREQADALQDVFRSLGLDAPPEP